METQAISLAQFSAIARNLLNQGDQIAFARFVLTGIWGENGRQAIVDPLRNTLPNRHPVTITRDYDSFLALVSDLPLKCTIYVYPVARRDDRLQNNIHLTHPITREGATTRVPIHKIPNVMFAKWGERNMIRAFFPGLFSNERTESLTQQEQTAFYNFGLRPAIQELMPDEASEWPTSYVSHLFMAQKSKGNFSFGTKAVGEWIVPFLGPAIRRHLVHRGFDWGGSLLFLLQVRGTKHGTSHGLGMDNARKALDCYLREISIPFEATQSGEWWIDVGVEFRSESSSCLQWRSDCHGRVYQFISGIDREPASQVTALGSSKYARDMVAHLPLVAGCRVTPGPRTEGLHHIKYFQLYTTDKAVTYNPEGRNHGKTMHTAHALGPTHPTPFGESLFKLYSEAIETSASHARLEIRVPFDRVLDVIGLFSYQLMHDSLLSFSKTVWWSLRAYRILAINFVLTWQSQGVKELRATQEALLLVAALVWLANGLHSRPDDGSAGRNLMTAVLPNVERNGADPNTLAFYARTNFEDEEDAGELPYIPYGLVFFKDLKLEAVPVPRFRRGKRLADFAFVFFFGDEYDVIANKLFPVGVVRQTQALARVGNRTRMTAAAFQPNDEAHPNLFRLTEKGYRVPPPAIDPGSDMDIDSEDEEDEEQNLDEVLTQIWNCFLCDMLRKSPNPKGALTLSYCKVLKDARTRVKESTYTTCHLSEIWRACSVKFADQDDFKTAFTHLWPKKGHVLKGRVQNYPNCRYYMQWKRLLAVADWKVAKAMRAAIRKRFNGLLWVPRASQDRMWNTAKSTDFTRLPLGSSGPAPQILVREAVRWKDDAVDIDV